MFEIGIQAFNLLKLKNSQDFYRLSSVFHFVRETTYETSGAVCLLFQTLPQVF